MSAPHILSTTIGSIPSFTITKDLAHKTPQRVRLTPVVRKAADKTKSEPTARRSGSGNVFIALALLATNIVLAAFYFYNVNNAKALEFNARAAQRSLAQLQDQQRQYQVHIAEASAAVRAQEKDLASGGYVPVGTPEFVSAGGPAVLTMR